MTDIARVQFNVKRQKTKSNNAGGTIADGPIKVVFENLPGYLRFHTTLKMTQLQVGPSTGLREFRLLVIQRKPFPDIHKNDLIEIVGGKTYTVLYPRVYDNEMQVDVQEFE